MQVNLLREIFSNEELLSILSDGREKVAEIDIVNNLLKSQEERKAQLTVIFLTSIETQKNASNEKAATRLLDKFMAEIDSKKITLSQTANESLDKVCRCYERGKYAPRITEFGKFPDASMPLSRFQEITVDLAHNWDMEIHNHATQDPEMQRLLQARDKRHEAGFSYDVIQSRNSPKIAVLGTPRTDRADCLNEFYKMLIKENVTCVVALNTFSDWVKAIPYYEKEQLDNTNTGWKITCSKVKVLHQGNVATNIPKDKKEETRNLPLDSVALADYRVRIEERTLLLKRGEESRKITHLHYINWPDRKEAPDLLALQLLMKRQNEVLKETGGTLSVHCQGGIGRTLGYVQGTWLRREIDYAIEKGEPVEQKEFNLPEMTYELKKQAPRLGKTPKGERLAQVCSLAYAYLKSQVKQ